MECVVKYALLLAKLSKKKIVFELENDIVLGRTVDCVNFTCQEMRLDPSSKWFDHKSNSCGLVSCKLRSVLQLLAKSFWSNHVHASQRNMNSVLLHVSPELSGLVDLTYRRPMISQCFVVVRRIILRIGMKQPFTFSSWKMNGASETVVMLASLVKLSRLKMSTQAGHNIMYAYCNINMELLPRI